MVIKFPANKGQTRKKKEAFHVFNAKLNYSTVCCYCAILHSTSICTGKYVEIEFSY